MSKLPKDVAHRCLCLELLWQRYALETDVDEPLADRERVRAMWLSRAGDLGVLGALTEGERALLTRAVQSLSDDELDDLHGRAVGASVLLWALGRRASPPTLAEVESAVVESGLLGDGGIARARASADGATLRTEEELDEALASYLRIRGKAKLPEDAARIFASVGAHHLTWILEPGMSFEDDIEP